MTEKPNILTSHVCAPACAPFIIMGVDPGVTTGLAVIDLHSPKEGTILFKGESNWPDIIGSLKNLYETYNPEIVVLENFRLSPRHATGVAANDPTLITVKTIGAAQAILEYQLGAKLVWHSNFNKNACPDEELLNVFGINFRSKHINDALRHCVIAGRTILYAKRKK